MPLAPLLALLLAVADPPDAVAQAHVRAAVPEVRALISETMRQSPIVRELVARLSCSDVIVYVEMTPSPLVPTARTKFVTAAGSARFLRIGLNAGLSVANLGPMLAHELQHAVEIADHEEVRDEPAVRRLYLRIGRTRGDDAFETDAARAGEAAARHELRRRIGG